MAKKKRRSSSSSTPKRGVNQTAAHQINVLLGIVLVVFLFASIFNVAGSIGTFFHDLIAMVFGITTPLMALFLAWYLAQRQWPEKFAPRFLTVLGVILFMLTLTGFIHSLEDGDIYMKASEGAGGGMLGYLMFSTANSLFGVYVSRFILVVLMIISLILVFDKALIPLLRLPEEGDEEGDEEEGDDQVPVKGELKIGTGGLFKKKPAQVQVAELDAQKKIVIPQLPRTANWSYPPVTLFEKIESKPQAGNIQKKMETIKKSLGDFGIEVAMSEVNVGPTVTQYTLKPSEGVKLNQITARQDDLALSLAAQSLRVEAPIPGKGLVGIEIPNEKKAAVGLRDILESKQFKQSGSKLALALGRDAAGEPSVVDLARMPHALVAGATGSGKSVCINSIILSLLVNNSPDELRMILVDPKQVELTGYNGLPHLLTPVITEPKNTVAALGWCVREMERRYKICANHGKRNIEQYNVDPDLGEGKFPYIVVIIDELADLMMVAGKEVESSIVRIAQKARAVGIHLIVATQRPSVDVITGLIKANVPTRIAFAVASQIDSRTIIDQSGAEKLLGQGDMLYVSTDVGKPKRVQGVFASEREINSVIAHIKMQEEGDRYDPSVLETRVESRLGSSRENGEIDDDLFREAYEVVRQAGKASSTLLQTRLSVGYARAARLIQAMEDQGLIGPAKGSKPREVYGVEPTDDEEGGIEAYPERE
jgi:S-DNA-T family DNA segregation ATPase FtsK/SpoIIIE